MTYPTDCTLPSELLAQIADAGLECLPELIRIIINTAMQIERQHYIGVSPYERSAERKVHANGYKPKTMTTCVGKVTFDIPQVREGDFYPQALEKGLCSERALTATLAEMYVQGVSMRKVAAIAEKLCGCALSSTQVSQATRQLDSLLEHWRTFLQSLVARGLSGLHLIISDAHAGLKQARLAVFGSIPWQRCQFHLQQNAQAYVLRQDMKAEVAADIRAIFYPPQSHRGRCVARQDHSTLCQTLSETGGLARIQFGGRVDRL